MALYWLGLLFGSALVTDNELSVLLATEDSHCDSTALFAIILREDCSLSMLEGWDGQPLVLFPKCFCKVSLNLDVVSTIQQ